MNPTKREMVEIWLLENRDIINYTGLDKRLGFPNGTIQKFFKYGRKFNQKRIIKIHRFLLKIGIQEIDENDENPK
ncbi:hypothetical protein [Aquimarina algiphila]|uniref:hypothetical protein n=1 Tax=Aquimarina algiphila TaxID=2047982 RepID=UPI00232ADB35|nr:hypothetical protein [Aquimarina algiphila]